MAEQAKAQQEQRSPRDADARVKDIRREPQSLATSAAAGGHNIKDRQRCLAIYKSTHTLAGVMKSVDVVDSKSTAGDSVPVRVRPPAPNKTDHFDTKSI